MDFLYPQKCSEDFKIYWAQALQRACYICNSIFPFRVLSGWRVRCACLIPQSPPLLLEWSVSKTLYLYNFIWKSLLLKQQDSVLCYGGVTESSRHCYDVFVGLSQLEAWKHAHWTLASLCTNTLKEHMIFLIYLQIKWNQTPTIWN